MRSITPSYVNEMADRIAAALEAAFPTTLFFIQPVGLVVFIIRAALPKDGYHPFNVTSAWDSVGREIRIHPATDETVDDALERELRALVHELRTTHLLPEKP